ncbi:MAG: GNAT family N-acetyltransferase [Alphaproteobacteria bacterium]|nr:GNAT family N-acetyltransferase [Alphaproteobacteria bacterium]
MGRRRPEHGEACVLRPARYAVRMKGERTQLSDNPTQNGVALEPQDPASPVARWCLAQYYGELDRRFGGGFDPGDAAYAGDADRLVHFVIALRDNLPVGCGSPVWNSCEAGEIKRMWVAPEARGAGLAKRILRHLEDVARDVGLAALRLDTNKALAEAQALYRQAGYAEIARYSDNPYAHHWFGKTL